MPYAALRPIPAAGLAAGLAAALIGASPPSAEPLVVPFDFSRGALVVDVTVRGTPLKMLLDTGVDPSLIDLAQAKALRLPIDEGAGGEPSGVGSGQAAQVFPSTVEDLAVGGRAMAKFDALAGDTAGLSAGYGSRLDGVLGYSFLADKIALIDYPHRRVSFLTRRSDQRGIAARCRTRWSVAMATIQNFPVIPGFRIGRTSGPVTFDTGSNGSIGFVPRMLERPDLRKVLTEAGAAVHTGARGNVKEASYRIDAPVGFGPFTLPAGQPASIYRADEATDPRIANVGNRLMDALHLKVLLDYPARRMTFYGACSDRPG